MTQGVEFKRHDDQAKQPKVSTDRWSWSFLFLLTILWHGVY